MDKEKIESLLIDYIDGRLSDEDIRMVGQMIATDEQVAEIHRQLIQVIQSMKQAGELEPGDRLKRGFEFQLAEEMKSAKESNLFFSPWVYRIAAGVVLVLSGVTIGYWINKNQVQQNELEAIRKEMQETKQLMMAMMANQQSASQRIQGVNVAMSIETADDDVVQVLVKTMNEDHNTNVRLAALEALSKFQQEPLVRGALVQSLSKQKDPVVQIALIQLMVKMKEKGVESDLKRIIEDVHTIKAVKDEAYKGLLKLS